MAKTQKSEKVLDCALVLLQSKGDHGVTMRQVAQQAGMSLSNVQYYFKNKDELLVAIADRYFAQCLTDIGSQPALKPTADAEQQLSEMLQDFLSHGLEVSEMCRIFREYWAISTRNDVIRAYLLRYYGQLADILAQKLAPLAANPQALSMAVAMIIPFVEGYSITAPALNEKIESVNPMLTKAVLTLLNQTGAAT